MSLVLHNIKGSVINSSHMRTSFTPLDGDFISQDLCFLK